MALQRNWKWIGLVVGVLVFVSLAAGWYFWTGPKGTQERIVMVPPKSGTALIARRLAEAGVVRNGKAFRYYTFATGQARKLKAGEYAFASGMTLAEVAKKMVKGDVIRYPVTVPEGFTLVQIAERVAEKGLATRDEFLQVARSQEWARSWGVPGDTLEGFLFPDTYELAKGMTADQIAKRMVDRFQEKVSAEVFVAGEAQGLNRLQLITLASIIEREVRAKQEQPMVASVFYNRLEQKKRLESCATVLYAQGRTHGALSLQDLETVSPYNTYRHSGLPPGPIGNPGLSAIRAVAYPSETEYLFFVVGPDGTHAFSKTFEEHKRAKWRQKKAWRRVQKSVDEASQP